MQISPHEIDFAYYTLRDGFNSTLRLVSDSPSPITFKLFFHTMSGEALEAPPMTIQAEAELTLNLKRVLLDLFLDPTGTFAEGSLSVRFEAAGPAPLVGQITVANAGRSLVFESIMFNNSPPMSALPRKLQTLWWGIGPGRDARVAVSNTADRPAIGELLLDFAAGRHVRGFVLRPHETRVLSVTKLLAGLNVNPADAPEGGITITSLSPTPALVAEGNVTDSADGFSTTLHFLAPKVQKASTLYASGVPIGTPSEDSPFAGAGTFTPHVVLRNLTRSPQTATITIEYPAGDGTGRISLAPVDLAEYTTKDVSLDTALGFLPPLLPFCSIRIHYSGPPGSAIAEVSSVEAEGSLVVDSKLANGGDVGAGSGLNPWRIDQGTESVLFLSNLGDKSARIGFQVQADGVHYYLTDVTLKPHETRAIDLRELRDAQKPDFRGNRIPADARSGSVYWFALDIEPRVVGRLIMLQRGKGLASNFDCYDGCCPPSLVALTICPIQGNPPPGDCLWQAMATYSLGGGSMSYATVTGSTNWSTNNPSLATFDKTVIGRMDTVSGASGTANATGSFSGSFYYCGEPCQQQPVTVSDLIGIRIAVTNERFSREYPTYCYYVQSCEVGSPPSCPLLNLQTAGILQGGCPAYYGAFFLVVKNVCYALHIAIDSNTPFACD